ncbi:FTR1 family iron permease [Calothrix sp. 336/3]|uniref:FTR1 family iron permease n=1 Tax=Calothrix sp. 336/3 TaxID=1337936 RepID=UPI0004E2D98C|nr:FTR1 family protein [Calothrix sp. 336/3]AKG23888.1 membrane protein [Calothrix sp. 336/3]
MNFSIALPVFVITLREGVEAALVVGIVLALLKRSKQSRLNLWVYAGIGAGIAASGCIGVLLTWVTKALSAANPQYAAVTEVFLEGVFSVMAIAMLSWMLLWMTKQAKSMKAQVEGAVTQTLKNNTHAGWGVFSLIFIAVVREGFETVLFISSNLQAGFMPAIGAIGGLLASASVGVMLFRWGIKINIRQFFQVMGVLLVLIIAGLVVTALQRFDEGFASLALADRASASLCFYYERFTKVHSCILGPMVWNSSQILPEEQFPGIILKSLFGYTQNLYLVQAVAYSVFLVTIGGLYLRSITNGSKNQMFEQKSVSGKG